MRFGLALVWLLHWLPLVVLAPLGYLVAKTGSTLVQAATPVFGDVGAPGRFFLHAVAGGAAGLVALGLLNLALVKFYPKAAVPAP